MSENPYQAPEATIERTGDELNENGTSREVLLKVAKAQKGILICILIYFGAILGQFLLPVELRPIVGIGILINGIIGAVFVFMLAMRTYGTITGVILGVISIIPLVGLLVLLSVNGRATKLLKDNGIDVGLLGANISSIEKIVDLLVNNPLAMPD